MHMKSETKQIRVTFLQVSSGAMKRDALILKAIEYFEKKTPLLFLVRDQAALDYLDLLLWRHPPTSFLPHTATDSPCSDLLVLTCKKALNPNKARAIFNLTQDPVANDDATFLQIYEFEDLSADNTSLFQSRYQTYKERGYTIVTL